MIDLVMILHSHQPVGNFDKVFALAHDKCYRPLLDLLHAHPGVRLGLHYSGCLLEWLEEHRPEFLDLLATLVARNQVEMLSGGFYEPLLAAIPRSDARGQVQLLGDYLERRFGRRPTGFWLTERIWDPNLPATLAGTGLAYTVVDDTHFYYAGLDRESIFGPYVTEKEGHPLTILATPMAMRYMIPFRQVPEVMAELETWNQAGRRVAVYGDDGEKFGVWPDTFEWVIQKGWLESFFTAIEDRSDWLRTTTPADYLAQTTPLGRLYMPQASYEEMTEWALPPERGRTLERMIATLKDENRWEEWRPFVRGGVWDNFLVKYEESNRMHKKMIFLGRRASEHPEARREVWRAQCNCAYWHGIFGGLYMGHLRRAIHEHLIKAQTRLIAADGHHLQVFRLDLDQDGFEELVVETPSLALGLAPAQGGGLYELCHLGRALNLGDVMSRRPEAYHHRLLERPEEKPHAQEDGVASIHEIVKVKEEGLERLLTYDAYTRSSLLDHFYSAVPNPEELAMGRTPELGDFVKGRYQIAAATAEPAKASISLTRTGTVDGAPLEVTKTIRLGRGPLIFVTHEFQAGPVAPVAAFFGLEFNLSLFSDQDEHRYLMVPEHGRRREAYEIGSDYHLTHLDLVNGGDRLKVSFRLGRQGDAVFFPLQTVSMSEDGFEKTYQGTSLFFFHRLDLAPGQKDRLTLEVELIEI